MLPKHIQFLLADHEGQRVRSHHLELFRLYTWALAKVRSLRRSLELNSLTKDEVRVELNGLRCSGIVNLLRFYEGPESLPVHPDLVNFEIEDLYSDCHPQASLTDNFQCGECAAALEHLTQHLRKNRKNKSC